MHPGTPARRNFRRLTLLALLACAGHSGGVNTAQANFLWAVGDGGTILHSTNSGTTWRTQASNTTEQLRAVDFVDFGYGWAVGNGGVIRHTFNGGATWAVQSSGTTQPIHAVDFIDRNTGWAVDGGGGILRTSNGGATWTRAVQPAISGALRAVDFQSGSVGWAAGGPYPLGADVLKTTDGGDNWEHNDAQVGTFATITGLDFSDANNGWAIANGNRMYRSTNGGASWTNQSLSFLSSPAVINNLDFAEGFTVGVGVGMNESWRTTNGASWTRTPISSTTLNDVSLLTTNNGWAVGQGGVRLRTTNGGANWTNQSDGTTANLVGVATIFSPGQSAAEAFPPSSPPDPVTGVSQFNNVPGDGFDFASPTAASFDFGTNGNSNFTHVGLPDFSTVADADSTYQISSILGTVSVAAGQTYMFPSSVSAFSILGINPAGTAPSAFPVFLQFDEDSVSFTTTPVVVPEPGSLMLALIGFSLLAIGRRSRKYRKQMWNLTLGRIFFMGARFMNGRTTLGVAFLAISTFAATSSAVPITVVNHSFEDGSSDPLPGWANNIGGVHTQPSIAPTPDPGDNDRMRWSNGGIVYSYQVLSGPNSTLAANTTYTLSVDLGDRNDTPFGGADIRLGTGSTMGANLLTPTSSLTSVPPDGGWTLWTFVYTTGAAPANLNEALRIELKSLGVQTQFDNVRLDAVPVPEPNSAILLALGCVALGLCRRSARSSNTVGSRCVGDFSHSTLE